MIGVLAIIQSLVGVGILIFGTPLLLVLDVPFGTVLSTLLPASLAISVLQVFIDRGVQLSTAAGFLIYMLPPLCIGLIFSLFISTSHFDIALVVVLISTSLVRLSTRGRGFLLDLAKRYSIQMQMAIGLVHGLSSMGGCLLDVYVSSRFQGKTDIRQNIALGYAFLAGSQLTILVFSGKFFPLSGYLYVMVCAAVVYLLLGRFIFARVSQDRFRSIVTITILLAAIALAIKKLV
jgi:uncharacterized protein